MSDFCNPMEPARLLCPWVSPGKSTGWVAISLSRRSSQPRNQTWASCIVGGFFTIWAARLTELAEEGLFTSFPIRWMWWEKQTATSLIAVYQWPSPFVSFEFWLKEICGDSFIFAVSLRHEWAPEVEMNVFCFWEIVLLILSVIK